MFKVSIDGVPERVRGQYASGSTPTCSAFTRSTADTHARGRFRAGPGRSRAARSPVISDGFWTRRFGRDSAVLGKSVRVGTQWVTIVGVTPPGFLGLHAGTPLDITIPMMLVEQGCNPSRPGG